MTTLEHVLTPPPADDVISAEPTKAFFVDMLVRDIALIPAVVDLVDNAVDEARRRRPEGSYVGLTVLVEADASRFRIRDNCGGMSLDTARNYAFRFGRNPDRPAGGHTIGQFGVGMKRTLFKIGQSFRVEAETREDEFVLEVDVNDWLASPAWSFPLASHRAFTGAELEGRPADQGHTDIVVTNLHADVAGDMGREEWQTELALELRSKHRRAIENGLTMTVGSTVLAVEMLDVLSGDKVRPQLVRRTYGTGPTSVAATFLCGLGPPVSDESGWYVFCNGRLILGPDTGRPTGWGRKVTGVRRLPRWHEQYNRFRGHVMLECDNPAALPWNTTKTALDEDSPIWRNCLVVMAGMARTVVDYLNVLDRARFGQEAGDAAAQDEDEQEVADTAVALIERSAVRSVTTVLAEEESDFVAPAIDTSLLPEAEGRVSYKRTLADIARAKELLNVTTNVQVGHATFDYFLQAEDG